MGLLDLMQDPQLGILNLVFFLMAILLALTVHEFSHAWVANYLGDSTPKRAGRVTLNPIAHLDPLGTIMLLLVRFGWGKPVPINPNNFKNPRLGSALTAVAGPTSNFLTASIFSLIYTLGSLNGTTIGYLIFWVIYMNLVIMIFNLLPIPPLDGSKFFALFFPVLEDRKFENYGPFILIAFVLVGGTTFIVPVLQFLLRIMGINIT
jgi:Zn-dependent protease